MLLEKPREIALSAKAKIFGNAADFILVLSQPADRGFHTKCIDVHARADPGAAAEEMIEVRTRQTGELSDVIQIDSFGCTLAHMPQRPADAIIPRSSRLLQVRVSTAPVRKPVRHRKTKVENQFLKFVVLIRRIRHPLHDTCAKSIDLVRDRNSCTGKEPGLGTIDETSIRLREPSRFDIERQKQGSLGTAAMQILVLLP